MRPYLVAGNWKMNGSLAANAELVAGMIGGAPACAERSNCWSARPFRTWHRWQSRSRAHPCVWAHKTFPSTNQALIPASAAAVCLRESGAST